MILDDNSLWWLVPFPVALIGLFILAYIEEGKCEPLPDENEREDSK